MPTKVPVRWKNPFPSPSPYSYSVLTDECPSPLSCDVAKYSRTPIARSYFGGGVTRIRRPGTSGNYLITQLFNNVYGRRLNNTPVVVVNRSFRLKSFPDTVGYTSTGTRFLGTFCA